MDLPTRLAAVGKTGLYAGFLGLLGASMVDAKTIRTWLPEWQSAYSALQASAAPNRLRPHHWLYYEHAVDAILRSPSAHDALWPIWRTWTHAICSLSTDTQQRTDWQKTGEELGLLGAVFAEKIAGLDAYLDMVEELIVTWARENGGWEKLII